MPLGGMLRAFKGFDALKVTPGDIKSLTTWLPLLPTEIMLKTMKYQ